MCQEKEVYANETGIDSSRRYFLNKSPARQIDYKSSRAKHFSFSLSSLALQGDLCVLLEEQNERLRVISTNCSAKVIFFTWSSTIILAYFFYIFDKEMVSSETNNNFRAKIEAFCQFGRSSFKSSLVSL